MDQFGTRAKLLKSIQASFIQDATVLPSEKAINISEARDSESFESEEIKLKPWEEPLVKRITAVDRNISVVRLPGRVLRDEEAEEELREREQRAKELVNYVKEKWDLQIDRKSSLLEVQTRTLEMLLHKKPINHAFLKRARQQIAERTGLFSDVRQPYEPLGVPELDNDMLFFRNLPDAVKINPDEWLDTQLRRQKEKEQRNARLPRIPRSMIMTKRTHLVGKLHNNPGGINSFSQLIAEGEAFQKAIRGQVTFHRLLETWSEIKEEETANRGSPFGQLKRSKLEAQNTMPDLSGKNSDDMYQSRKMKSADENKIFQEFLNLEKMMAAIYHLIKSMLNVKIKQIKSQNRIPFSGVLELRSKSPDRNRRVALPSLDILKQFKGTGVHKALHQAITGLAQSEAEALLSHKGTESEANFETDSKVHLGVQLPILKQTPKGKKEKEHIQYDEYRGTGRKQFDPFLPVYIGEIYPLGSTEELRAAIQRVHKVTLSPSYLDDRPYELRNSTLKHQPIMAQAEEIRRHNDRFRAMFLRHEKAPEPIWWDVHVRGFHEKLKKNKKKGSSHDITQKSVAELLNDDELAIPWTKKIPDPDDIPTPELPGGASVERLESAEQSRLNLLNISPNAFNEGEPDVLFKRLYAAAGIQTTEKDFFEILMKIKGPFRALEKRLKVNAQSEREKFDWDTPMRYKSKIRASCNLPIYEKSMACMRFTAKMNAKQVRQELSNKQSDPKDKRPAPWFRELIDLCDSIRALKHQGCSNMVHKLVKYCDVTMTTKTHLLRRFCLLVVSLPANELGAPHFQKAILFLLDKLFGAPVELLPDWLDYANIPLLI